MKNILFSLFVISLLITSCGDSDLCNKEPDADTLSSSEIRCNIALLNVKKIFPNSKIFKFPDKNYQYIVVDSSGAKYVTCLNQSDDNINNIQMLIELK